MTLFLCGDVMTGRSVHQTLGVWHIIPPREDSPPFCRNPLEIRHDHREELRISLIACWYRPCQLHG